jgi:hypothetical protein
MDLPIGIEIILAKTSVGPPAANGTTKVIVLVGYCCALLTPVKIRSVDNTLKIIEKDLYSRFIRGPLI